MDINGMIVSLDQIDKIAEELNNMRNLKKYVHHVSIVGCKSEQNIGVYFHYDDIKPKFKTEKPAFIKSITYIKPKQEGPNYEFGDYQTNHVINSIDLRILNLDTINKIRQKKERFGGLLKSFYRMPSLVLDIEIGYSKEA